MGIGIVQIVEIGAVIIEKIVPAVIKIAPEIGDIYEQWKRLYQKWKNGDVIEEDEVQALRLKVDALSASNSAAEDAIINGDGR